MTHALTNKHFSILRVAKNQLGLSEEDYRAILVRYSGQDSAKGLKAAEFQLVMKHFERLGFQSSSEKFNRSRHIGMASAQQIALIQNLWENYTEGQGTELSLGKWIDGKFKVSSVRFLTADKARKVITALKAMNKRKSETA